MICKIQSDLEQGLPFKWVSLAVDVAELFAGQSSFAEGTQEAWVLKQWFSDFAFYFRTEFA